MIHIKITTIGKIKESWLIMAIEEYEKRLKETVQITWNLLKKDSDLEKELKNKSYICLDLCGKAFSSDELSKYLMNLLQKEGSYLNFVIGGAEGLSSEIKKNAKGSISLSNLTFTHQITRLILIEQLYRAFEIEKGSNYHK